jgi:flagellin
MALRIQTNVAALNAQRQLNISDMSMSKSLERLSSGFRINKAGDDVAGLSMSAKFVSQIRAMGVASRNASQANSLLQIAEGGTDQIGNILTRLKELATQAASANSNANLTDINNEATALKSEIDRIASSTTFQGTALLTGYGTKSTLNVLTAANAYDLNINAAAGHVFSVSYSSAAAGTITMKDMTTSVSQNLTAAGGAATYSFSTFGISFKTTGGDAQSTILGGVATDLATMSVNTTNSDFQIGEKNDTAYRISFMINEVTASSLSVNGANVDLSSAGGAQTAMDKIDSAISALVSVRGEIGAIMNRLDYTMSNLAIAIENASAANSVIKDVDMAAEMTIFTKTQILVQAGTAMLGQANMAPQSVLSLIGK